MEGCAVKALGEQSGRSKDGVAIRHRGVKGGTIGFPGAKPEGTPDVGYGGAGNATRFYPQADWSHEIVERLATCAPVRYCAKASRRERDSGLEAMPELTGHSVYGDYAGTPEHATNKNGSLHNLHPCCKPISLCVWLAKLLLPPPEYAPRRILVPFSGSGSEMAACVLAGWEEVVGIEMSAEYVEIAEARLRFWCDWYERGCADPAEILRRQAVIERNAPSEKQMVLQL